jgi:hypothetical protein
MSIISFLKRKQNHFKWLNKTHQLLMLKILLLLHLHLLLIRLLLHLLLLLLLLIRTLLLEQLKMAQRVISNLLRDQLKKLLFNISWMRSLIS